MNTNQILTRLLFVLSLLAWLAAGWGGQSESLKCWPGIFALATVAVLGLFTLARGFHGRASLTAISLMTAFVVWVVIRCLLSPVHYLARQDLVFCLGGFASYVLVAAQIESGRQRKWILAVAVLLLLGNAAAGFWQIAKDPTFLPHSLVGQISPATGEFLGWTGLQRIPVGKEMAGFYQSENHFAGFLEIAGLLCLGAAVYGRRLGWRLVFLGFYLLALVCVVLSQSRGGFVSFLVGSAVLPAVQLLCGLRGGSGFRRTQTMAVAALVVIMAGGAVGFFILKKSYGNMLTSEIHIKARKMFAHNAWEQFLRAPVQGTGARSYEYEERSRRTLQDEDWLWWTAVDTDAIFAHNDWAQVLGDYGALGGILALLTVLWHGGSALTFLRRQSKKIRDGQEAPDDPRIGLTAGALAVLAAMALHSIIDFNMHIGANVFLMGLVLGLLANPGRRCLVSEAESGQPLVPSHGIWLRPLVVTLAGLGAGYLFLHGPDWFASDRAAQRGLRMRQQDNYFEGEVALQKATTADPQNFGAWQTWGAMNMDEAIRWEVEGLRRDDPKRRFNSQVRSGFLRKASEKFAQAWKIYPQNPYSPMQAAEALSMLGQFDDAEMWFKRAFEYGKASRLLYMLYGDHLVRRALVSTDRATTTEILTRAVQEFYRPAWNQMKIDNPNRFEAQKKIEDLEKLIQRMKSAPAP